MVNKVGEINCNTLGTKMKIVEYKNANNIVVEFQDEHKYKTTTKYCHFKNGQVKNPYDKSIFGVGYIGVGKYKVWGNKKNTKTYDVWHHMLQRCYDPYYINKEPAYKDCFVCELWHCYQNFAKWWEENVYNCNNERLHLDKDILCKGNKIYSPETCVIVPERINTMFVKCDKVRGEYPVGVNYYPQTNKLVSRCNIHEDGKNRRVHLGYFPLSRPFQAFYAYKQFKENYIKEVAEEYKNLIPQKLYNAMYRYEVEIND